MDFTRMVVELLTPEGMRKDHTHCAPSGYYFLPVYAAGWYRLRVCQSAIGFNLLPPVCAEHPYAPPLVTPLRR
jgi:hypothetical protein